MNQGIIIAAVALMGVVAGAQTNAPDARAEQLRKRIEDQIRQGASVPIQLTPEEDALLVKEGVLPPVDQPETAPAETNAMPRISLRMRNVPLAVAAESYSDLVGKKVMIQEGLNVLITVQSTGSVTRAQAAVLMEKAFAAQGLRVAATDSAAVQIERK